MPQKRGFALKIDPNLKPLNKTPAKVDESLPKNYQITPDRTNKQKPYIRHEERPLKKHKHFSF
jgi:hypothetical protein